MATKEITVCARIIEVKSVIPKHKPVRDYEAEKRVKEELQKKLKEDGAYESMSQAEFQRRYRKKLREYAQYLDCHYIEKDGEDGKPGLVVSKRLWENEIRISYKVGNKSYTQMLSHDTKTKCLRPGGNFFITVNPEKPKQILRQSIHDYRTEQEKRSVDVTGCFLCVMLLLVLVGLWFAFFLKLI